MAFDRFAGAFGVQIGSSADLCILRNSCVKIDARGLEPGASYFYRFIGASEQSPVGRSRTLPEGGVEQVKLAVFSCTNYPADGYATERSAEIGRALPEDNGGELLTFRREDVKAEWKFIDNIDSTEFAEAGSHRVVHSLA